MDQFAQAILTVLSLVNPVICGALFAGVAGGKSTAGKIADATKASLAVVAILGFAALAGAQMLKMFGISLDAFQVAGGLVLGWMGFAMLRGSSSPTASDKGKGAEASLTPLILFAASPGTITGVITLAVAHSPGRIPVTTLVAIAVALAITWAVMIVAARSAGGGKQGMMHDVTSRFMGLIVLAMGGQFMLSGLKQYFSS
jgi:multiple antibiotic resistance protein